MIAYVPSIFRLPEPDSEAPPYVFSDSILLAIDVALAAGRPLLVSGSPGSGKTTLARVVAAGLGSRFLSHTVTSRTRLEDLEAEIDMLRRLADAQTTGKLKPDWAYLKPGILWWAFDPASARRRGAQAGEIVKGLPQLTEPGEGNRASRDAVVLLDEIDKADPDLPNDLLEPLDRKTFSLPVPGRPPVVAAADARIFLIMTTNRERELPPAFLRRCVTLDIPDIRAAHAAPAGAVTLERIAQAHFADDPDLSPLYTEVAKTIEEQRTEAQRRGLRPPSTAEYVDTLRALKGLPAVRPATEVWKEVKGLLMLKSDRPE